MYNLMKSTAHVEQGDSGGSIFMPRTDANGGSIPIGIIRATGGTNISYFTSINDLPTSLQTGRY